MTIKILAIGAVIAGIIGGIAYLPQITHLIKIKNSTGISVIAWLLWTGENLLLLVYAISIMNITFIIVEIIFSLACLIMVILTLKYRQQ